jgi:hypothetical protein
MEPHPPEDPKYKEVYDKIITTADDGPVDLEGETKRDAKEQGWLLDDRLFTALLNAIPKDRDARKNQQSLQDVPIGEIPDGWLNATAKPVLVEAFHSKPMDPDKRTPGENCTGLLTYRGCYVLWRHVTGPKSGLDAMEGFKLTGEVAVKIVATLKLKARLPPTAATGRDEWKVDPAFEPITDNAKDDGDILPKPKICFTNHELEHAWLLDVDFWLALHKVRDPGKLKVPIGGMQGWLMLVARPAVMELFDSVAHPDWRKPDAGTNCHGLLTFGTHYLLWRHCTHPNHDEEARGPQTGTYDAMEAYEIHANQLAKVKAGK